jgi:uncharacterized protein (TIGR03084 family)
MRLPQARDFLLESEVLARLLAGLAPADWTRPTLFKDWSADDIVVHLHFWNRAADLSAHDPDAFARLMDEVRAERAVRPLRAIEGARIRERGAELLAAWQATFRDIADRWQALDPSQRVKWSGPDMSVRSSITARQMETWSHGQALFDLFAQDREESDRLLNIVVLGVNTYGWTFRVRGLEPPMPMPWVALTLPSGAPFSAGDPSAPSAVRGDAVAFCQVVAQTRNVADTALQVEGEAARQWMRHAQCFAGPPQEPPPPGYRRRAR